MQKKQVQQKQDHTQLTGKYLTFRLADQEFGVRVMNVREIIGYMRISPIPQTPVYMKGVINLRGSVIPIIDLRLKFVMEEVPVTEQTCIIVVDVEQKQTAGQIGVIVDNVSEVYDIKAEQIEDKTTLGSLFYLDFILGLGKIGNGVKILLDINRLLQDSEIHTIVNEQNETVLQETYNV